jgi:hypothetical protein
MDDWSLLPRRNAVSEPAPNPQSTISTTNALPAGLAHPASSAPQPAPTTHARTPQHLTRPGSPGKPGNQPGAKPQNPRHRLFSLVPFGHPTFERHPPWTLPLTRPGPSWMTQDVFHRRPGPGTCLRFGDQARTWPASGERTRPTTSAATGSADHRVRSQSRKTTTTACPAQRPVSPLRP